MIKNFALMIAFVLVCASCATKTAKDQLFKVRGIITDFSENKLSGAEIHFQDEKFNNLVTVVSDEKGEFTANLPRRDYRSIFACKDYAKKYLEYWHWNYKPKENDFLDIKIDGLELYGMTVWSTEPTYKSLIIYFRPMSLRRALAVKNLDKKKAYPVTAQLKIEDIKATVDGKDVVLLGMNKLKEFMAKDQHMEAYTVQISTKSLIESPKRVCLSLKDFVTEEKGMGCVDL